MDEEDLLRHRIGTSLAVIIVSLLGSGLQAQSHAPGATTTGALFDPTRPSPVIPSVLPSAIRHTTISSEEYYRRKQTLRQRAPVSIGPPGLELIDLLNTGRAPSSLPLQPLALSPSISFEGIGQTLLTPPGPDLAAGPSDIILVVNSSIARYGRDGQQTSLMTLQQWFSNILPTICPHGIGACRILDPSIRYDSLHGRFLLSAFSEDALTRKTYFVLSVSNGATYGGGWKNWALEGSLNGTAQTVFEVDFPRAGYDNNAVYLTANMFDVSSNVLQYAKIRILKKSELYNPAAATLTFQDIWNLKNEDNSTATSISPIQLRGQPGTGVPAGILINASDAAAATYLTLWRIDNPTSATPAAVRTTLGNVWTYDLPALVPQQGSALKIDPGDTRILRAIVRNGVLYTARNTGYASAASTVTYDRIDLASNKVTLQARQVNGNFFFPAFDIPASQGPGNALPNKLITGTTTGSSGALTYAGISEVKAGEDAFEADGRWGDYFGGAIDPIQGGLWTYGEYAKPRNTTSGRWGTWAAYFPMTTSPQFTDVLNSSPFYDFINVLRLWSITTGCGTGLYCPDDPVTRGQMAVFVIRALLGGNFTAPATPSFTDVPTTHPFFNYIQKLKDLGITSGCTATTFCPDDPVTRGQMAAFVIRGKMRGLYGGDTFPFPQTPFFTDVATAHPFFRFVQQMRDLGVTSGCTATTYCPDANVTREQMAAFIVRAFLN
ncbi:MAG: hypothetical protein PGMFKBFP_00139 [Anaerolineales bacterium]|nr:hypothetical protein [Anaerolineales bacterium]